MRPQQAGEASRADDDGRAELRAEQFDRLIAGARAFEQFWRKLDRRERGLVRAHGDLVAGAAVDHVEQHARKLLAGKPTQRRDAVAFALERRSSHTASSR